MASRDPLDPLAALRGLFNEDREPGSFEEYTRRASRRDLRTQQDATRPYRRSERGDVPARLAMSILDPLNLGIGAAAAASPAVAAGLTAYGLAHGMGSALEPRASRGQRALGAIEALLAGIPFAGIPGRGRPGPPLEPAAIRWKGKVYRGAVHADALQKAVDAGAATWDEILWSGLTDRGRPSRSSAALGFVDQDGSWLTRDEALRRWGSGEAASLPAATRQPDQVLSHDEFEHVLGLTGGDRAKAHDLLRRDGFIGYEGRDGLVDLKLRDARLAPGAPDLGPTANRARAELQARIQDYVQRETTSAPKSAFGSIRFLEKDGIDEGLARRIAKHYDETPSNPNDPDVKAAYEQFAKEIDEQYDFVTKELGIEMVPAEADPYRGPTGGPDSAAMAKDLFENRRLQVFTGGNDHPLLTPEQNVKFRFIHDVLGHGSFGNSFAARGEENAFRAHSEMFSPLARGAMATETRGQNSWVNYGPNAHLPANQRPFAEQKVFVMPEDLLVPDLTDRAAALSAAADKKRAPFAKVRGSLDPLPLFDYSNLDKVPDVPQHPLPRNIPRRPSERIEDALTDPNTRRQVRETIDEGVKQGAHRWYNLEPLLDVFKDELPEGIAANRFKMWGQRQAAASARTAVPKQLGIGQYLFSEAIGGRAIPEQLPKGYGGLAQKLHLSQEQQIRAGEWDPVTRPKSPSYAENFSGNLEPGTLDVGIVRDLAMRRTKAGDPRWVVSQAPNPERGSMSTAKAREKGIVPWVYPRQEFETGTLSLKEALKSPARNLESAFSAATEYGPVEEWLRDIASRKGLATGQAQAAWWAGAAPRTGVGGPFAAQPFLKILEDRIKYTAKVLGVRPADVLRSLPHGGLLLSAVGLSAVPKGTEPK